MKITAIAVVLCMLLCTVSPIIYDWSEDHAVDSYATDDDVTKLYVSLGDSVANGYGMVDYYGNTVNNPDDNSKWVQYSGFLSNAERAYPKQILNELKIESSDWELLQLAVSGMRTNELVYLLDLGGKDAYTDSGFGDRLSHMESSLSNKFSELTDYVKKTGEDGLKELYQNSLKMADIITLNMGMNNIGTAITETLEHFMYVPGLESAKWGRDINFNVFDDTQYEEYLDEFEILKSKVLSEFNESGLNIDEEFTPGITYGQLVKLIERVIDQIIYGALTYISGYDLVLGYILKYNPECEIYTIDMYNILEGVDFTFNGIEIPLSYMYGKVIDTLNMYVNNVSVYSYYDNVHSVSFETSPSTYIEELTWYGESLSSIFRDYFVGENKVIDYIEKDTESKDEISVNLGTEIKLDLKGIRDVESIELVELLALKSLVDKNNVNIMNDLQNLIQNNAVMNIYIRCLIGTGIYCHPSEAGHEEIKDRILEVRNSEKKIEAPWSWYGAIVEMGGLENAYNKISADLQDTYNQVIGVISNIVSEEKVNELKVVFAKIDQNLNTLENAVDVNEIKEAGESLDENVSEAVAIIKEIMGEIKDSDGLNELYGMLDSSKAVLEAAVASVKEAIENVSEFVLSEITEFDENIGFDNVIALGLGMLPEEVRAYVIAFGTEVYTETEEFKTSLKTAVELGDEGEVSQLIEEYRAFVEQKIPKLKPILQSLGIDTDEIDSIIKAEYYKAIAEIEIIETQITEEINNAASQIWSESVSPSIDRINSIFSNVTEVVAEHVFNEIKSAVDSYIIELEGDFNAIKELLDAGQIDAYGALSMIMDKFKTDVGELGAYIESIGFDVDVYLAEIYNFIDLIEGTIENAIDITFDVIEQVQEIIDNVKATIEMTFGTIDEIVKTVEEIISNVDEMVAEIQKDVSAFIESNAEAISFIIEKIDALINAIIAEFMYLQTYVELIENEIYEIIVVIETTYESFIGGAEFAENQIAALIESIETNVESIVGHLSVAIDSVCNSKFVDNVKHVIMITGAACEFAFDIAQYEEVDEITGPKGNAVYIGGVFANRIKGNSSFVQMGEVENLADYDNLIVEADAESMMNILRDALGIMNNIYNLGLVGISYVEPDFTDYESVLGESASIMNEIDSYVEDVCDILTELDSTLDIPKEIVAPLAKSIVYYYVETFIELECINGLKNAESNMILIGAYNIFKGSTLSVPGGLSFEIGDIYEVITDCINMLFSEYAEERDNVIFINVNDYIKPIYPARIDSVDVATLIKVGFVPNENLNKNLIDSITAVKTYVDGLFRESAPGGNQGGSGNNNPIDPGSSPSGPSTPSTPSTPVNPESPVDREDGEYTESDGTKVDVTTNTDGSKDIIIESADGSVTSEITVTKDKSGKEVLEVTTVVDVKEDIDMSVVDKAISQISFATGGKDADVEIVFEVESSKGTISVDLNEEAIDKIVDSGAEVTIRNGDVSITFSEKVLDLIEGKDKDASLEISHADEEDMTDKQKDVVGDHVAFEINLTVGDERIHKLGGHVEVSLPFTPEEGMNHKNIKAVHVDDEGKKTKKDSKYESSRKAVIMTTDHFSVFMIDEVEPSSSGNTPLLIVGAIAVIIVVALGIGVYFRRQ